ncbi:MAG: ABC transporter ATP-binding protein [Ruminiclostridium sp.]|nr:ABC transporter ATP-binding protein [Ruminiclostridium sp.]
MKLVLDDLTKVFPPRGKNGSAVVAVDSFSFEIPDGKLVGLLGPSGCGKSTALNLICGLLEPSRGKIFFGEDDVTELPPEKRGVGMVFQHYALYPHLTVLKNILFPLENLRGKDKLPKEEMLRRAHEAARVVQIEKLLERKPSELSGGQQQRVAIARALVKSPRVLLLDEPLSNLDARLRLQTREEIRRIQRQTGITTVFVTHDQEEAMSICDMIVVMRDGKICQIGHPQQVYEEPVSRFVAEFLGTPPINMFEGEIKDGGLYIGADRIFEVEGAEGGKVAVGIRPEGFEYDKCGNFPCTLGRVELMGRDVSIVAEHPAAVSPVVRAIIDADEAPGEGEREVRFSLKPNKVRLFDPVSGERICCKLR